MTFATPESLEGVSAWEDYLYAQLGMASLGSLSPRIARAGISHVRNAVTLHFRVTEPLLATYPEIDYIADYFCDLTDLADVTVDLQPWEGRRVGDDDIQWTYAVVAAAGTGHAAG